MSAPPSQQLSRGALIALVVGLMVGAGIFTLPAVFARSTGALGALISWAIAGSGMPMLAFVFQTLSRRRPDLDAGIMPAFLAGENANRVPCVALWLTNLAIQAFLLVTWFAEYAFTIALRMTSSMTLIPYLLVAAFGLKLAWTGETCAADRGSRNADRVRAALATVYAAGMLFAGGAKLLMLSALLFAPGTWLFLHARREQQQQRVFSPAEAMLFGGVSLAAVAALYGLASGAIAL